VNTLTWNHFQIFKLYNSQIDHFLIHFFRSEPYHAGKIASSAFTFAVNGAWPAGKLFDRDPDRIFIRLLPCAETR